MAGGVLVFNASGELVFVLEEQVGKEFDMELLQQAIQHAREGTGPYIVGDSNNQIES